MALKAEGIDRCLNICRAGNARSRSRGPGPGAQRRPGTRLARDGWGGGDIRDAIAACDYKTSTQRPVVDRAARVRIMAAALAAGRRPSESRPRMPRVTTKTGDERA